jgi:hypothetical protein
VSTTPQLSVLCCGGIGESGPADTRTEVSGLISFVTAKLNRIKFVPQWVPWADQYGPVPKVNGTAYAESLRLGLDTLADAIRNCPNDVVGIGYSAGATLWGRFLEELEIHGGYPDIRHKVKGVAFIAHPERRQNDSLGNTAAGWGVGGEWAGGPDEIPIIEIAAPDDVICSCAPNSPIRMLADWTEEFSFVDVRTYGLSIRDRLLSNRWQAVRINWLDPIGTYRQFTDAAKEAEGYLFKGYHTDYHKRIMPGESVTYTDKLAQVLNASTFR